MHVSRYRFETARYCGSSSAARSSEVRVSYFDPITGKPCKKKPIPRSVQLKKEPRQKKPPLEKGRSGVKFSGKPRNGRAVLVDGVRFESISAAATEVGVSLTTLSTVLRNGASEYKGRSIAYADKADGR